MARLKLTSDGQVRLDPDMLDRLGVKPGDELDVEILAVGRLSVPAGGATSLERFFGCLSNEENLHYSIEDLNQQINAAWAGRR